MALIGYPEINILTIRDELGQTITAPALRIVQAQLIATVLVTATCVLVSWVAAYSALLGGLSCLLPSAFMAWRFLRVTADPTTALANLVRGEAGKMVMTVVMFVVIFTTVEPLRLEYFLAALVIGLACNAVVPVVYSVKANATSDAIETNAEN